MSQEKLSLLNPFAPTVAKITIPEKMILELNNYVDEIISDEKKSEKHDHGSHLVGNVKQEIYIDENFVKKIGWLEFLGKGSATWIEAATKKKITKFNLIKTWVVRQFKNEYNPIHWHGGHISGAGFLKVPSSFGKPFQENKRDFNGNLTLINGTKSFMCNSKFEIKPKVGDFYIFPHYLMHTVYPFNESNEERRSISFNAEIDNNIFNVFGSQ